MRKRKVSNPPPVPHQRGEIKHKRKTESGFFRRGRTSPPPRPPPRPSTSEIKHKQKSESGFFWGRGGGETREGRHVGVEYHLHTATSLSSPARGVVSSGGWGGGGGRPGRGDMWGWNTTCIQQQASLPLQEECFFNSFFALFYVCFTLCVFYCYVFFTDEKKKSGIIAFPGISPGYNGCLIFPS
jgi:hypothetical protein